MCNEHEGCFQFGSFTCVWDACLMAWSLWTQKDELVGYFRQLADAKTVALWKGKKG